MKQYGVILIKTPSDKLPYPIREERYFVPLGLISIATYLNEHGHSVLVLDGQHRSMDYIKKVLQAQKTQIIVGIDFHFYSVRNFEELTRFSKNLGHSVVTGGQAATHLANQILLKNPSVDCVVRHDGERPLLYLVENRCLKEISNLSYRYRDKIIHNPVIEFDLSFLPIPDLKIDGITVEEYLTRWDGDQKLKVINVEMQRGCPYKCPFCARTEKKLRSKNTPKIVAELKGLQSDYGINFVFIYDDTFAINAPWLESLHAEMREQNLKNMKFWIFGDIRHLKIPGRVRLLKKLGIKKITVGIESGDPKVRKMLFKFYTNAEIEDVARELKKYNIILEPSVIIGLPGETKESYILTYRLLKKLESLCHVENTAINKILPLPGSAYWNRMLEDKEFREKYGNEYRFNDMEVQEYFLKNKERLFINEKQQFLAEISRVSRLKTF